VSALDILFECSSSEMYTYRVMVKDRKENSVVVTLSLDMIQGIYSLFHMSCGYYMSPQPNARVLNSIVENYRKLEIRRTDTRDASVPLLSRIAYDTPLFRLSDFMFTVYLESHSPMYISMIMRSQLR